MTVFPVTVRPLLLPSEIEAFFRLASSVFNPDAPHPDRSAAHSRWAEASDPDYRPGSFRGAFHGKTLVGGCIVIGRSLRLGAARLPTACIGAVVTHPHYRRQGVARAIMLDAGAYARDMGHALLMLDGIAGFYGQFGYTDILDIEYHAIDRDAIAALPPSSCAVRPATTDDAPAILDLYRRHYGPYPGGFERSLPRQTHVIARRGPDNPPVVALAPSGEIRGYLVPPWNPGHVVTTEVAADDWDATRALLHFYTQHLAGLPDPPAELWWPLPPDSPTFFHLADRLWLRSVTERGPIANWMARVADVHALARALVPAWRERRLASPLPRQGTIVLEVGGERFALEVGRASVGLQEEVNGTPDVVLTQQALTQLCFGFRPAWWLALQPGERIPNACLPVMEMLFPPLRAWVPGADAF